jgi:DNA-binding response OmpR family regulator
MEGCDLCSRFRQRDDTRSIPIILLVGRGYTPMPFAKPEEGPDDYLQRPCTSRDLQVKIDELLRKRESQAPTLLPPKPEPAAASRPESGTNPGAETFAETALKLVKKRKQRPFSPRRACASRNHS